MNQDINDFLQGGGGKAAKFEELGDSVTGTITDARVTQQTSLEDNTPLTWSDGSPRMQLVISLQTDLHDDSDDDGIRKVYAKGGKFEVASGSGSSMKEAIADAVKRASDGGKASLAEGGKLTVAFTGLGKKTNRAYSAPKLYKAKYEPPTRSVAMDDLFDD